MKKRVLFFLMSLILICQMSLTAYAAEVPDMNRKGTISITMRQGDTVVPGGELNLYRVGEVKEENGDYSFVPTGEFKDCGESFENVQSSELAARLAEYAIQNNISGTVKQIGNDGKVIFEGLEVGLYLIVQNKAAEGYYAADPFLVTVPYMINGKYVYEIDASPKVEIDKPTPSTTPTPSPTPTPSEKPGVTPTPTPSDKPDVTPSPSTPTSTPKPPKNPNATPTPKPPKNPDKLPQTGQLNWPIPLLVVSGLVLFASGWILCFGRREEDDEK